MLEIRYGHLSFVPFGNNLVLFGANGNEIFKLTCANRNCSWTKMPQKLSMDRKDFVAIPILRPGSWADQILTPFKVISFLRFNFFSRRLIHELNILMKNIIILCSDKHNMTTKTK